MSSSYEAPGSGGNAILKMAESWNAFWFKPADPTMLGLMRICCGLLVVYVHLAYSFDLQTFFGRDAWIDSTMAKRFRQEAPTIPVATNWHDIGPVINPNDLAERLSSMTAAEREYYAFWTVDPAKLPAKGKWTWSIWNHVTDPTAMWIVHFSIVAVMLAFALGLCTRVTSVLTWVGMMSYIQRAPNALFGMDTIMVLLVFYLMIGPSGAALSLDRLIKRYWVVTRARRRGEAMPPPSAPSPSISANLALRLLQVHMAIVYGASGVSKLLGGVWWEGTATWLTMANFEFSPLRNSFYMAALEFICAYRWRWGAVVNILTYGTLAFEVGFPFLIWNKRLRPLLIIAAVGFHMGIAICMGLVTFSMMMLIGVLSYVPAELVVRTFSKLRGRNEGSSGFTARRIAA